MNNEPGNNLNQDPSLKDRIGAVITMARTVIAAVLRDDRYEVAEKPHPSVDHYKGE